METINFDNLAELQPETLAEIPQDKSGLVLFELFQTIKIEREYRKKLAEDHGVFCEKVGKLEGENDDLKKRLVGAEKALIIAIDKLNTHQHLPTGEAAARLNL